MHFGRIRSPENPSSGRKYRLVPVSRLGCQCSANLGFLRGTIPPPQCSPGYAYVSHTRRGRRTRDRVKGQHISSNIYDYNGDRWFIVLMTLLWWMVRCEITQLFSCNDHKQKQHKTSTILLFTPSSSGPMICQRRDHGEWRVWACTVVWWWNHSGIQGQIPCWGSGGQSVPKAENLWSISTQMRGQKLRI